MLFEVKGLNGIERVAFDFTHIADVTCAGGTRPVATAAMAEFVPGEEGETAFAYCHPNDNFSKAVGRKYALSRLLVQLGLNREDRAKVWQAYAQVAKFPSQG